MNATHIKNAIIGLGLILLSGCTSNYYITSAEPSNQNNMQYQRGIPVLISHKTNSTVELSGKRIGSELWLRIFCRNESYMPTNLIQESITVEGMDEMGEKVNFKVYGSNEYLAKMQNAQAVTMALQSANAGMQAQQAGYSQTTTTSTAIGSAVGSNGVVVGSAVGTSVSTTYDPSKVAEAQYRNQQMMQQQANQYNQINQSTSQILLSTTTLQANQKIEGCVVVKVKSGFTKKI